VLLIDWNGQPVLSFAEALQLDIGNSRQRGAPAGSRCMQIKRVAALTYRDVVQESTAPAAFATMSHCLSYRRSVVGDGDHTDVSRCVVIGPTVGTEFEPTAIPKGANWWCLSTVIPTSGLETHACRRQKQQCGILCWRRPRARTVNEWFLRAQGARTLGRRRGRTMSSSSSQLRRHARTRSTACPVSLAARG
jgi:hypothetical protein